MDRFHDFMMRYTLGLWGCISAYCKWAESQAKNDKDLLVLGIGPVFVLGLLLWSLPGWIGKPIAFILSLPALYLAFLVLRAYSVRTGKRK
ncbi:conjugal transfer protein TrbO [Salmonella enterica subsp. enterica serovar Schwarzengrund]|nr:conjugal transfer protein TrbO [Salmonella enterica subsp. enterica serovar Schwarzengrund]